ncbi:hypothetical protein EDD18DRAFT_1462355 [Armillaria luteobubalina]|uniref:Uncharacterized protein n=1 Tax=Armillaria luteobubalina TaxID=153913 RepID=A0AA39Q9F4_9AGAR|nr:hypothetical protein EDD18DRAFT_1462355 [Armillaria luteobubalina]
MLSPSPTESQDALPYLELLEAPNFSFKHFSECAQRKHLTTASEINALWDTMSASQSYQFVVGSGPQGTEKQIRENPFPPSNANVKRSTSPVLLLHRPQLEYHLTMPPKPETIMDRLCMAIPETRRRRNHDLLGPLIPIRLRN